MNVLLQWLRMGKRVTPSFRPQPLRLKLEQLEDRWLLSTSTLPDVTFHGGPVLQNVQVENVFYGSGWSTNSTLEQTISQTDTFLQYFVTSPYFNVLQQYNVGAGTFLNQDDVISQDPSGQTIDDSQIRQILNGEITNGNVAAPTANQLYIFYTAPGVTVTADGANSIDNFSGYHDTFTDTAGAAVYYAVLPYPSGGVGNGQLSDFQQETLILSREISNAATDPDTQTGWFDPRYGEIANIANGQYGTLNGYVVSGVWSQADEQVVIPSATSTNNAQVSGVPVEAIPGQPFTSIVATITDAPSTATTSSYTATIDWGNGTTSSGMLATDPDGGFDVIGSNTYTQAGSFPIAVTVNDTSGNQVGAALTTAKVSAAAPTVQTTGTEITTASGQAFSGTVATFTDTNPSAAAGNYSVTINWGDGTTSAGTVANIGGDSFAVTGSHTYTLAAFPVSPIPFVTTDLFGNLLTTFGTAADVIVVNIDDTANNTSATALSLAAVTPATPVLTETGDNVAAVSGQTFSGVVATFTDSNPGAGAGDFTATINWGNGTSAVGTVAVDPNGGFEVLGSTTFNDANYWFGSNNALISGARDFDITVTITDNTGDQAVATSTATVTSTAKNLLDAAQNITATAGQSFSGVVATFSDTDSSLGAGDFTATIKWGDGTTSTGQIVADPNGGFDVIGTHTYSTTSTPESFWGQVLGLGEGGQPFGPGSGSLPITVKVGSTVNGDKGTSEASATIEPATASVQTTGTVFNAVFGQSFSGTVATFTSALNVSGWSVTINWGDGTTSAGTIVAAGNDVYDINGTHTYGNFSFGGFTNFSLSNLQLAGPQPFLVTTTIDDPADKSTATVVSLASVTSKPPTIAASGVNLNLTVSNSFTGTVATFTDAAVTGTSGLTATIAWGDGTISSGTITANPSGTGDLVGGTHPYRRDGVYTITVFIQDGAGNSAVSLSRAVVGENVPQVSLNTVAEGILQSVEYFTDLVVQDYQQFLNRTPLSSEINYWVGLMQNGATNFQVQAGFLSSQEFFNDAGGNNIGWLDALYQNVLGRSADSGEGFWQQQLAGGLSLNDVALGFENSQEHEGDIVQGYYQQYLGRTASSPELSYWVNEFENGLTNLEIVAGFLSSQEYFQNQYSNPTTWLTSAYQSLLSRQPDQNGLNGWLPLL